MQKSIESAEVHLLVGYLGAGKTTLIRRILQQPGAERLAVIQNEFAEEMGIEAPFIVNAEGTPFKNLMELPNGCICCSAKNDLLAAIQYLVQVNGIRRVVVETNGVADPANSIRQFWLDDNMKLPIRLQSIICIVPCHRIEAVGKEDIFAKQLIYSNKIILNFLDKAKQEEVQRTTEVIAELNPSATLYRSTNADLLDRIFVGDFFSLDDLSTLSQNAQPSHNHQQISSLMIKIKVYSSPEQLERNIGVLLWQAKELTVLRIKGLVVFEHEDFAYELQGVCDTFELRKSSLQKSAVECSKILVIGKHLSLEKLVALLTSQS